MSVAACVLENPNGVMCGMGVYWILNTVNGKRYVGSSINLRKRQRQHEIYLRRGVHHNRYLQRAWDLDGAEAFLFEALEYVADSEALLAREQYHLDALSPEYNLSPTAGNMSGFRHSEATKQRMGETRKGHAVSEETRRKMSEAIKGRVCSAEHRQHLSAANKGKVLSEEIKAKISEANKGKMFSAEHRRRMSEAGRGEKHSNAKLSEQDVREIRNLLQDPLTAQVGLARRYNVSQSTICGIKHGRVWAHVV